MTKKNTIIDNALSLSPNDGMAEFINDKYKSTSTEIANVNREGVRKSIVLDEGAWGIIESQETRDLINKLYKESKQREADPKGFLLSIFPEAVVDLPKHYQISSFRSIFNGDQCLGHGVTEDKAWYDAMVSIEVGKFNHLPEVIKYKESLGIKI